MRAAQMQSDVTFSLSQVIWLAGGIMAIVAFVKWLLKPIQKIENHEQRISSLEELNEQRNATDRYTMKALNAIVNYMLDGSDKDKLREVRDEYQREIINHM